MSNQAEQWSGDFGNEYHRRNQIDWWLRIPFWRQIVETYHPRSVLEFGCGPGWNLSAIREVNPNIQVEGSEINEDAQRQAYGAGVPVYAPGEVDLGVFEMVVSAGFLIHIPPQQINHMIDGMIGTSCRYVTIIEYEDTEEVEVEYRGQKGMLWRRPYGDMFKARGLTLRSMGKLGKDKGFDDCSFWVFEK